MAGSIVVTGIKEIDRTLKELEPKIQRKVLRQAMRSGMKIVFQYALQRVPIKSGLLKRNLKLRAMKRKGKRIGLLVSILADPGFVKMGKKTGKRYWYPASVEWGHGSVPAHPFMRPAYDLKGKDARDTTMRELLNGALEAAKA